MDDPTWTVILQHDSIRRDLGAVCRLLCCSKELRAAVSDCSTGQLTLCIHPAAHLQRKCEQYEHLAHWIAAHGRLLHTLEMPQRARETLMAPVEALIASALAAAANPLASIAAVRNSGGGDGTSIVLKVPVDPETAVQAAGGATAVATKVANAPAEAAAAQPAAYANQQQLALRTFSADNITSDTLLQHLPRQLRSLSITLCRSCTDKEEYQVASRLADFTCLTKLYIGIRGYGHLMAALSSLSQLQVLDIPREEIPAAAVRHLPQQLRRLQFTPASGRTEGPLQLQHLTALTALHCYDGTGRRQILAGDVLPAGLLRLRAIAADVTPLLTLRHLQELDLAAASLCATGSQLGQLTTLQALTALHVHAFHMASFGAALLQLPIKQLVTYGDLPLIAVQQLGQLQCLTGLSLVRCSLQSSYQQLSESLQKMTALQMLAALNVTSPSLDGNATFSLQFVTALPALRSCSMVNMPLQGASLTALQAATGLTRLECISRSSVVANSDVTGWLQKLTSLQQLAVTGAQNVTSGVLSDIIKLTQLTSLILTGTAVGMSSVQCLTALHHIKELRLDGLEGLPGLPDPPWLAAVNIAVVMQLTCLPCLTSLWLSSSAFWTPGFPSSPQNLKSMLCDCMPYCDVLML